MNQELLRDVYQRGGFPLLHPEGRGGMAAAWVMVAGAVLGLAGARFARRLGQRSAFCVVVIGLLVAAVLFLRP